MKKRFLTIQIPYYNSANVLEFLLEIVVYVPFDDVFHFKVKYGCEST
jgi:hypothetical protein